MANGASQAVENATRLSEIGFPEFTAQLITDTFNAITASYLNQTSQYYRRGTGGEPNIAGLHQQHCR